MLSSARVGGWAAAGLLLASSALACGGGSDGTGGEGADSPDGGGGSGATAQGGGGNGPQGGGGNGPQGGGPAGGGGQGAGGDGGGGGVIPGCEGFPEGGEDAPDVAIPINGVTVTTLAGSGTPGLVNSIGTSARFDNPVNLALHVNDQGHRHIYITDFENGAIRESTLAGTVSTLIDVPQLGRPFGILALDDDELLVQADNDVNGMLTDPENGTLWRVNTDAATLTLERANIGTPRGMALLPDGRVVLSDLHRSDVRLYDPSDGTISPLAGSNGCPAFEDGQGDDARFHYPYGVVIDGDGNIILADQKNHRIRKITLSGVVTTLAGDGTPDMVDGPIASARFNMPQDLAIDAEGNLYVSDWGNKRIRRISASGMVRTVAGSGAAGFADGAGNAAQFFGQEGLILSEDGSTLYLADGTHGETELPYHRVRKITLP
jgi:sugar lactone lactonase YvrE